MHRKARQYLHEESLTKPYFMNIWYNGTLWFRSGIAQFSDPTETLQAMHPLSPLVGWRGELEVQQVDHQLR